MARNRRLYDYTDHHKFRDPGIIVYTVLLTTRSEAWTAKLDWRWTPKSCGDPLDAETHVTKVMSTASPWRALSVVARASLRQWLHWKPVASGCMNFHYARCVPRKGSHVLFGWQSPAVHLQGGSSTPRPPSTRRAPRERHLRGLTAYSRHTLRLFKGTMDVTE